MSKQKVIVKSMIVSSLLMSCHLSANDLGVIRVESSTIDSRFQSKRDEVSSVQRISGERVEDSHIENIQQVLQQIPGMTTEVTSGDNFKVHIRGVENQVYMGEKPGVAVVIDGVPVFERTGAVNIDLDNIESIEVIKGGASYLFGDDALAGAIIITTKKGAKYNHNYAAIERGSFGYQKLLARTGYSNDYLNFHLQASERKADGYHENSDYKALYINGKLQYYIDDMSDVTFGVEYSEREKDSHGTVGGATEAKNNPKSIFNGDMRSRDYTRKYDVELLKLFATYYKDFENDSNLMLNAYMYKDDTFFWSGPQTRDENYALGDYTNNDYVNDNYYEQTQTGLKAEYRTAHKSFATMLGVDMRDNEYKNKTVYRVAQKAGSMPFHPVYQAGDIRSHNQTDEKVYAIYGEYKHAWNPKFETTLNLRYDTIKYDYSDINNNKLDKNFRVYSHRIGANYHLNDNNTIFTNYSTGFRAPTVNQLYAGDLSAWGSTESNPNLKPEKSHNYEVGLRGYSESLYYEASIFYLERKDFIMKSSGNYGTTDTTDRWDNIGGAKHQGLELSLGDKIFDSLSYNIAYTYLDAKYTDYKEFGIDLGGTVYTYDVTGNRIPRTSKHMLNLLLDYEIMPRWNLITEFNAKSNYYADDLNQIKISGHETVNLLTKYRDTIGGFEYDLFARVDNLFDKQYYNTARSSSDRNNDGVFDAEDLSITVNPGRTFKVGVAVKF